MHSQRKGAGAPEDRTDGGTETAELAARVAELEATCERYARAIRGASDGFWEWNVADGEEAWWSPTFYAVLGYADGEIPATSSGFRELVHPGDLGRVLEAERAHLEERAPYDLRIRMRARWGAHRWFRVRAQSSGDQSSGDPSSGDGKGAPVRLSGSIQDVTDLVEAEAWSHRVRGRRERVDSIVVDDGNGHIEALDRRAVETVGGAERGAREQDA